MHFKEYPKSRVCGVDYYPHFVNALKESYLFCKKYKIPYSFRSKDIQKFFYHYCLEKLCYGYQKCNSKYPKAFVVYPLPKDVGFTDKHFEKVLKVLPVPWVKVSSFDSPDTEMALVRALSNNRLVSSKLEKFLNKNALYNFQKKNKKSKTFSLGTVDLSDGTPN
jgi:hypothetical protein